MAELPIHRPPQFELFRNESIKSQDRKKKGEDSKQAIISERKRNKSGGLSWPEQRFVDMVAPAECVNKDDFDTFKYSYQVYAAGPPVVDCEAPDLNDTTLRYNVRRVARDKRYCPKQTETCNDGSNLVFARLGNDCNGNNSKEVDIVAEDGDVIEIGTIDEEVIDTEVKGENVNQNNNEEEKWSSAATRADSTRCEPTPEVTQSSTPAKATPGYGTYKIIGGRQYHQPHKDYYADIQLPPEQEEYQEFQRRCPNYKLGRYDRSQVSNLMMLSADRGKNNMQCPRTPFVHLRNSRAGSSKPLFAPEAKENLDWPSPGVGQ